MKSSNLFISAFFLALFIPAVASAQKKRLSAPRFSKVVSVDSFAVHTFEIYNKIFVYDSLTKAEVEIPSELEDQISESLLQDLENLNRAVPDILSDVESASLIKKVKAAASLNRSRRALTQSIKTIKIMLLGEPTAKTEIDTEDYIDDTDQNE